MPANLAQLINVRSQLAEDVLAFLANEAEAAAELPAWYPEHLKDLQSGAAQFDTIRQVVQAHDRKDYDAWLAQEQERRRAAGQETDTAKIVYSERVARTYARNGEAMDEEKERKREIPKPKPVVMVK